MGAVTNSEADLMAVSVWMLMMKKALVGFCATLCISLGARCEAGTANFGMAGWSRGSSFFVQHLGREEQEAYGMALRQPNPVKKAILLENFIARFPESE